MQGSSHSHFLEVEPRFANFTKCIVFNRSGSMVAFDNENVVELFDLKSGKELHQLEGGFYRNVEGIEFSPDGTMIAGVAHGENYAVIWNTATGQLMRKISPEPCDYVTHVAFSPDGRKLALTCGPYIELIDPKTGLELAKIGR